jgi:hypothetical protein
MSEIAIFQPGDVTVEVANNKNSKNAWVANTSGLLSFGTFPENNHNFPVGEITLKLGYVGFDSERKGAYGLRHIWEKHGSEVMATSPSDIPLFIEGIITSGSTVIVDRDKDPKKPLIVKSSIGLLTLGLKQPKDSEPYYHIITAYVRKSHPGIVIATI